MYDPEIYGNLAEWVGIMVTALTIFLTIKYYSKDNKTQFQVHVTNKVVTKKEGVVSIGQGLTLVFYNTGKVPTAVRFEGLINYYNFYERLIRKVTPNFFRFSNKAREWHRKTGHEVYAVDLSFFEEVDFEIIRPFEKPYTIKVSHSKLLEMATYLSKNSKKQKKRLRKNKKIKFQFVYLFYDGQEKYFGITITPDSADYKHIIEKVLPNT